MIARLRPLSALCLAGLLVACVGTGGTVVARSRKTMLRSSS